jgi:hypothetical protein
VRDIQDLKGAPPIGVRSLLDTLPEQERTFVLRHTHEVELVTSIAGFTNDLLEITSIIPPDNAIITVLFRLLAGRLDVFLREVLE